MAEMRGFMFAITFIIIFLGLVVSVPADLAGLGDEPDIVTPVDSVLLAGFSASEDWNMTDLTAFSQYGYNLNARDWVFSYYTGTLQLGAKNYILGFLWFGSLDSCEFINDAGETRGGVLSTAEIDADALNGSVRYELRYLVNGLSAGGFIVYWNSTVHTSVGTAFVADAVYFLHGVGVSDTAVPDVLSLMIGLLTLQLPDCPPLINLLLATFVYGPVIYIIWFIIKESMPFV